MIAGEFGGLIPAGTLGDLPVVGEAPVNFPEGRFYLMQTEEGLVALHKVCTHLDSLFNWDDQISNFVCPYHGSRFYRDGTVLSGPATRSFDRFVIQMLDSEGQLVVETDELLGGVLPVPALPTETDIEGGESETAFGKESWDISPEDFSFLIEGKVPGEE